MRLKSYRFFADRIELEWKAAFRRGKETYTVAEITGAFAEQETFAYGIRGLIQSFLLYVLLAVVLHLGFDHQLLRMLAYAFYVLAAGALAFAISKMKTEKWLYVKKRDGSTLLCFRVNGLRGVSREDLEREIKRYPEEAHRVPVTD